MCVTERKQPTSRSFCLLIGLFWLFSRGVGGGSTSPPFSLHRGHFIVWLCPAVTLHAHTRGECKIMYLLPPYFSLIPSCCSNTRMMHPRGVVLNLGGGKCPKEALLIHLFQSNIIEAACRGRQRAQAEGHFGFGVGACCITFISATQFLQGVLLFYCFFLFIYFCGRELSASGSSMRRASSGRRGHVCSLASIAGVQ